MKSHPVSIAVNHPDNDSAELIVRVDAEVGYDSKLVLDLEQCSPQKVHASALASFGKIVYRSNVKAVFTGIAISRAWGLSLD
jgi:hypothetical protein